MNQTMFVLWPSIALVLYAMIGMTVAYVVEDITDQIAPVFVAFFWPLLPVAQLVRIVFKMLYVIVRMIASELVQLNIFMTKVMDEIDDRFPIE